MFVRRSLHDAKRDAFRLESIDEIALMECGGWGYDATRWQL